MFSAISNYFKNNEESEKLAKLEAENKTLNILFEKQGEAYNRLEKLVKEQAEKLKIYEVQKAVMEHQTKTQKELADFDFNEHASKLLHTNENALVVVSDPKIFELTKFKTVSEDGKWTPNRGLKKLYDSMTKKLAFYYQYKNKIKELNQKVNNLFVQLECLEEQESSGSLNYDRLQKINVKQELYKTKTEITKNQRLKDELEKEGKFDDIMAAWESYFDRAIQFIEKHQIEDIVVPNDILDFQGIYNKYKSLMDEAATSVDPTDALESLRRLKEVLITPEKAHHEARGQFLSGEQRRKEIENLKTAEYHEFNRLDAKVQGKSVFAGIPKNSQLMNGTNGLIGENRFKSELEQLKELE